MALKRADNLAQAPAFRAMQGRSTGLRPSWTNCSRRGPALSLKQLAVNGGDLTALGLSGPAVGETLEALLTAVMDGALPNDREALLTAAREIAGQA